MWHEHSRSRSSTTNIPWMWAWILVAIWAIIVIARSFSGWGSDVDTDRAHLLVSPMTNTSMVFISMTDASKNRITGTWSQPLYVWDKSVSVEVGWATAKNSNISVDLDERTELSYIDNSGTGESLSLTKWRIWLEQLQNSSSIKMKNFSATVKNGDIVILEQNNQIYSTAYALKGDIEITTTVWSYTLKAWSRIMVSASDLANPGLQLSSLVGTIDESITLIPLFVRNNGKDVLKTAESKNTSSGELITATGNTITTNATSAITILDPIDGSIASKPTIAIKWTINIKDIKKITFNEVDAVVSPVEWTFSFKDFPITSEVNNIVYKVYNIDGKQVEKWVVTVFGSKWVVQQWANTLVANSSPVSSKDFKITNPDTNPFVTTDRFIKVQWIAPKWTVDHIIINDYRLQKYIAGSTNWYYFANMDTATLTEWINLYTIKFYWKDNELLYTQLFTIIKESKNATISGESSR